MQIFLSLLLVLIVALIAIAILHRYYRKSSREFAIVRTGFGGRRVELDGAALVLPFLHQAESIPLRSHRLVLDKRGKEALVTGDSLRVDVVTEFSVRVAADELSVATAASTLGAQSIHSEDLDELLRGRLSDAVQQVVAKFSLAGLHKGRHEFSVSVNDILQPSLNDYGLVLDAVSLLQLDQASLETFDQNNVFDAVGLRQLSQTLSEQRLQRVNIDAQTEVSVRETELASLRKRLELEQQQSDLELAQRQRIEVSRAQSDADIESTRQQAQQRSEEARLSRERDLRQLKISHDLTVREEETKAHERAESVQIEAQVSLAHKRAEESSARATAETKRSALVQAQEQILLEKESLAAERNAAVALIRQRHLSVMHAEESASREQIKLAGAQTAADVTKLQAEAKRLLGEAKAQRIAAIVNAENLSAEHLLEHKIALEKVRVLPEVAKRMAKPLEKIDSIRINHLGGMGAGAGAHTNQSPLGDSLQQVMGLAVQMPALKKLGEEIGLDFDPQLGGRMADAAGRVQGALAKAKPADPSDVTPSDIHKKHNPQESEQ